MAIRRSIGIPALPFEVWFALQCCNNKLVLGDPNTTPDALLSSAMEWDEAASIAAASGKRVLAGVYERHARRYEHAAHEVEQYCASRNRR